MADKKLIYYNNIECTSVQALRSVTKQ